MKEKYLLGVVKQPDEYAEVTGRIENTLDGLQKLVRGYIETVTFEDCVVICNEEGRILRMAPNCRFRGVDFFGPIVVVSTHEDEFDSLTMDDAICLAVELDEGSYE